MSGEQGNLRGPTGSTATESRLDNRVHVAQRVAIALLVLFLVAIVVALAVTLSSVAPAVRLIAGSLVCPIIALALVFLYFESRGRPWSFVGAAVLGALGVSLRLVISTQPQLEVGGGLPTAATVIYVTLGLLVVASNAGAYLYSRKE